MRFRLIQSAHWQGILLIVICSVFVWSVSVHAQTPGTWDGMGSGGAIVAGSTIVPVNTTPHYDSSAQLKCVQKKVPTRKSITSPALRDDCWYPTKWGLLSKGGEYLVPKGYDVAGKIFVDSGRYDGRMVSFRPTTNPDVLVHSFFVVNNMHIYRSGNSVQFKASFISNGALAITADFSAATQANTSVSKLGGLSYFSDSSRWIVRSNKGTVTRYDTDTMRSVSLGAASTAGLPVFSYADIDDSGRYIVFSLDNSLDAFKIIDMDTCTIPADTRDAQVSGCSGFDLRPRIVSELGYTPAGYGPVRFVGDSIVQGWAEHPDTGQWRTFYIYAPSVNPDTQKYLALGDSFASGEGAYNYVEGTDVNENKCHLSTASYPYLFLRAGTVGEMRSLACSGAKMENVRLEGKGQQKVLDKNSVIVDADFNFIPGIGPQLKAAEFASYKPTVVTVSISGNDIGFADKITECILPYKIQTCFNTYSKRLGIAQEILSKHDGLVQLYNEIQDESAPNARVYAVGYPQIVDPAFDAKCDTNVLFDDEERAMAHDLVTFFNAVIKHAALTAGVRFVGVESAFSDHVLCGGKSTKAVNGLTHGNDTGIGPIKFIGLESYHPNAYGHKLLYERIKSQTDGLTSAEVDPPGAMPDPANYPLLASMESTTELVPIAKIAHYLQSENTVALRGSSLHLLLSNMQLLLKPNTTYRVELHSDPVQLGEITSNGLGEIVGDVTIPEGVEPGLHSIHILGTNENGEEMDIYEYLYVAASVDDFDGDGILDADEPCGMIEPSGVDYDQDGMDDACDAEITQPSEAEPNPIPTPDPTPEQTPEIPDNPSPAPPTGTIAKIVAFIEEAISYTRDKIQDIVNNYVTSIKQRFSWFR